MSNVWSDKKKYEVVTTWLALGKVPMVEGVTGVPKETIRQWKMQPWWAEMVTTIQTESNQELDSKLSAIIERSLDAVNERIENGEFKLDARTGKVLRVPVQLRDVHRVAVDLLDKRQLVRNLPLKEKQEQQNADILKKLADQFSDWVKLNMKQPKAIEGEVLAVYEERSEGLRNGVPEVPLTEEADREPGSPKLSS